MGFVFLEHPRLGQDGSRREPAPPPMEASCPFCQHCLVCRICVLCNVVVIMSVFRIPVSTSSKLIRLEFNEIEETQLYLYL